MKGKTEVTHRVVMRTEVKILQHNVTTECANKNNPVEKKYASGIEANFFTNFALLPEEDSNMHRLSSEFY